MLEVGHEFRRHGIKFCVIDFLKYNDKTYCLLSVEKPNEKMSFSFYDYKINLKGTYELNEVEDKQLIATLFELFEERK